MKVAVQQGAVGPSATVVGRFPPSETINSMPNVTVVFSHITSSSRIAVSVGLTTSDRVLGNALLTVLSARVSERKRASCV